MNNFLTILSAAMLLFFAATVGYFAHRMDVMDARISNIELAKDK